MPRRGFRLVLRLTEVPQKVRHALGAEGQFVLVVSATPQLSRFHVRKLTDARRPGAQHDQKTFLQAAKLLCGPTEQVGLAAQEQAAGSVLWVDPLILMRPSRARVGRIYSPPVRVVLRPGCVLLRPDHSPALRRIKGLRTLSRVFLRPILIEESNSLLVVSGRKTTQRQNLKSAPYQRHGHGS